MFITELKHHTRVGNVFNQIIDCLTEQALHAYRGRYFHLIDPFLTSLNEGIIDKIIFLCLNVDNKHKSCVLVMMGK